MTKSVADSEEILVKRALKGDRKAYRSIYDLHVGALFAICARYIPGDEDAKDVLQESFLRIFGSLEGFDYRGPGSMRNWMSRIVVNEALKAIKLKGRIQFAEIDQVEDCIDSEDSFEDIDTKSIFTEIRQLPDGYRTIFNLYVIEHKTHKEIAAMLGIKESTSASQLHRAKAMLASRLRPSNLIQR